MWEELVTWLYIYWGSSALKARFQIPHGFFFLLNPCNKILFTLCFYLLRVEVEDEKEAMSPIGEKAISL